MNQGIKTWRDKSKPCFRIRHNPLTKSLKNWKLFSTSTPATRFLGFAVSFLATENGMQAWQKLKASPKEYPSPCLP